MTRMLIAIAMALAVSAAAMGQGDAAREQVLGVQKQFIDAYRSCNIKEVERLTTSDMTYLHSTGGVENKAQFIKGVSSCGIVELAFEPASVRFYGDTALIVGTIRFKSKNGLGFGMPGSQLYVKQNGEWRFAHHQSTEPVPAGTHLKLKAP